MRASTLIQIPAAGMTLDIYGVLQLSWAALERHLAVQRRLTPRWSVPIDKRVRIVALSWIDDDAWFNSQEIDS